MQAIKILVFLYLLISIQPAFSQIITLAEATELMRDVTIPKTWRLAKKIEQWNRNYPNTYCAIFNSKTTKQWIGKLCLTTNKEYISDVGIRDEVPEEEDWADRSKYEVGYWRVTPLSLYPMTPFILKPIKTTLQNPTALWKTVPSIEPQVCATPRFMNCVRASSSTVTSTSSTT